MLTTDIPRRELRAVRTIVFRRFREKPSPSVVSGRRYFRFSFFFFVFFIFSEFLFFITSRRAPDTERHDRRTRHRVSSIGKINHHNPPIYARPGGSEHGPRISRFAVFYGNCRRAKGGVPLAWRRRGHRIVVLSRNRCTDIRMYAYREHGPF